MNTAQMLLSGWGNYPRQSAVVSAPARVDDLRHLAQTAGHLSLRGSGLSYGDAALGPQIATTVGLDACLAFDEVSGIYRAQAGRTLAQILRDIVAKGWFLPVTPGTAHITLGGAVACDIHGKNHHVDGCFSQHVIQLQMLLASGKMVACSPTQQPDLFWATCGGMGLTGAIVEVTFSLKRITSALIERKTVRCPTLPHLLEAMAANANSTYSVSWTDLSGGQRQGRSLLFLGEHRPEHANSLRTFQPTRPKLTVPSFAPNLTHRAIVLAFNALYWSRAKSPVWNDETHINPYFYPLDAVARWNNLYGRKGFLQYQFVVPHPHAPAMLEHVMRGLRNTRLASPLAVIKAFGHEGKGWLSFPKSGITLAMDLPVSPVALKLLDEFDDHLHALGGRVYLAKDARLSRAHLQAGYGNLGRFEQFIAHIDPERKFFTALAHRLLAA